MPLLFGLFSSCVLALDKDFERVISAVRNLPDDEEGASVDSKATLSGVS